MITREEWEGYVDDATKMAAGIVADSPDGFELAACHLLCSKVPISDKDLVFDKPQMLTFVTQFSGETVEEVERVKENFVYMLQMVSICGLAEASIFMTETWMSPAPVDGGYPDKMPSEDPDRLEGIIVIGFHREYGPLSYLGQIQREGNTRRITSWDTDKNQSKKFEGRFLDIIDKKEPNESDIAYAKVILESMSKEFNFVGSKAG